MTVDSTVADVLTAIVDWYADPDTNADLTALPTRRYTTVGPIGSWAHDCEQVVVCVGRVLPTAGDLRQEAAANIVQLATALELYVDVTRAVPTAEVSGEVITLPDGDVIQAAAEVLMADVEAVHQAVAQALSSCCDVVWMNWTPSSPSGGFQGGVTTFRVALD